MLLSFIWLDIVDKNMYPLLFKETLNNGFNLLLRMFVWEKSLAFNGSGIKICYDLGGKHENLFVYFSIGFY